ncbi:MAG: 30S ribosomal protein S4, partial [Candidatus Thermoplasmatota archaeon]|nr:30S ribosomal protein S4 [Candidatus Thermoplasmatota archaeon]
NILERRLQTVAYLKGLAHTARQARQFIVHGHISVSDRKVTIPGYLVPRNEEDSVRYHPYSDLANEAHPARPSWEVVEARRLAQEGGE